MRGRPLLHWVLFLLAWTALLYPVIRVTQGDQAAPQPATMHTGTSTAWVSLRFSQAPHAFELRQGGRSLWNEEEPGRLVFERTLPVEFDRFGAELNLAARLPDSVTAVEVAVESDGRALRSRTLWVSGNVDEVVGFSWGRDD